MVLLPNAFHCWVSTGFSIHESVALAPWDCLGAGCDAERSCRQQRYPTPVSQTELLVTLVSRALGQHHHPRLVVCLAASAQQALLTCRSFL